jgi:Flp pilus assembly pilin Flp
VEYGLIVAGIFLAIMSAVNLFASNASAMYNTISSTVAGVR